MLHGDPLDLILFNQTNWEIAETLGSEKFVFFSSVVSAILFLTISLIFFKVG